MTGVQTCALPICFPVTIKKRDEQGEEQEGNTPNEVKGDAQDEAARSAASSAIDQYMAANPELFKAYVGEDTLVNFTKAWANVANGGEVSFDTIDSIVKGDVKELKEYVKALSDNKLRVLVGVKDEKYQTVYNRHFGRLKPTRDDLFIKALNEDYGSFNAEYSKDLKLGIYSPGLITADKTETQAVTADAGDDWDA